MVALIVDDDDALREVLGECLEAEGYRCWPAGTADDALERLERESDCPDLILLDLWLPRMPPAEFISRVKRGARWSSVPIILMTAVQQNAIPRGMRPDALLLKPFDVPALLQAVHEVGVHGADTVESLQEPHHI